MLKEVSSEECSGSESFFDNQSQSDMSSVISGSVIGKTWTSDDDDDDDTLVSINTKENGNATESISGFLSNMLGNPFGVSTPSSSSKNMAKKKRIFFSSIDEESDDDDDSCTDDDTDDESRVLSSLSNKYKRGFRRGIGHKRNGSVDGEDYSLNGTMNKLRLNNKTTSGSTSRDTRHDYSDSESSCSSAYYSTTFDDDDDDDDDTDASDTTERSSTKLRRKKNLDLNDSILQDGSFKTPPKRVDYNSDLASLYRAIDTKEWEEAGKILYHSPHTASTWVYRKDSETDGIVWMFLPIHAACFSGAPVALIRDLVRCYPKSVGVAAPGEKLPVHIACETGASYEVVSFLVDSFSESLYHVDGSGNTPLQLCIFSMSGKNRQKVMKVLTTAAAGKTSNGPKISRFRRFMGKGKRKDGTDYSVGSIPS